MSAALSFQDFLIRRILTLHSLAYRKIEASTKGADPKGYSGRSVVDAPRLIFDLVA